MNTRHLLSISLALSLVGISQAQTVDPDFEPADSVDITHNVTPLSNGGYLVNGYILGVSNKVVTRLYADGTADESFDSALVSYDIVPEFQSHSLAMLANGNVLVYGTGASASIRNLVMLKPDGSIDSNFGQMLTDRYVACYAVQSDGKVLIGGRFTTIGGQARNRIARLNTDGTLDADFNTGTISNTLNNPRVLSIAPLSNGKILIGGQFESVQGQSRNAIAMLNADGSLDTGFNLSMNSNARAIALQPDGKILIGGNFTSILGQPRNRIARLNADGSLDSGFDPNASATVESMVLQADGKIIVTGGFTSIGGQPRNRIARLNSDGTLADAFNAFDPDPNTSPYSVALQQDGKMLVGGFFSNIGGQPSSSLVRLFNGPAVRGGPLSGARCGRILAMAREARGGGVCGVWFGVFPPLEESCPQGSEARMGPWKLVGASGSCGQLSGAGFHLVRPLGQVRIPAGRVARGWRSRAPRGCGDGCSRASIRRYRPPVRSDCGSCSCRCAHT
jgi:uncharacterized delta-60 repeat protein